MPGSMIHLLFARVVRPDASPLFNAGTVAPDAVKDRDEKEATHFRNLGDRLPSLTALAQSTDGDFAEGVLLHLWFDWCWDASVREEFIERTGDGWFPKYRDELFFAGGFAYHHTPWAAQTWSDIAGVDQKDYGTVTSACADDINEFIQHNHKWHSENNLAPSEAFPPELINGFITDAVIKYQEWRESVRTT